MRVPAIVKVSAGAAAVLFVVWASKEYTAEKSELRASLGGRRYQFSPWTDEQKSQALAMCIDGAAYHSRMPRSRRDLQAYNRSFCQCATRNYEGRETSYAEFLDLLPAIARYADPNSSGYFCTDVAERAAPEEVKRADPEELLCGHPREKPVPEHDAFSQLQEPLRSVALPVHKLLSGQVTGISPGQNTGSGEEPGIRLRRVGLASSQVAVGDFVPDEQAS